MSANDVSKRTVAETDVGPRSGNRLEAAAILLLVLAVMAASWWLTPSASGHGTHQQLLLIPCGMQWLAGLPCPMCGMTTAFTLMARGEVFTALTAHVLGPALYLMTVLIGVRAGYSLVRGLPTFPAWALSSAAARWVLLILLLGWGVNLALTL